MGLVLAALSSATGVLADQWKEYFYCDSLSSEVLAVRGKKRTNGRSANFGDDNIISNGSVIAIADGQCMMIVEQGQVIDICSEPGEYIYDMSSEPSVFVGNLADNVAKIFESIAKRFSYGGQPATDQRVYFFNIKEISGNKYGTPAPIPFRVVDERAGIDLDVGMRCFGEFSYKITNPLLFYKNVCGNMKSQFLREDIEGMLKTELLTALQPAFARISEMGIRYSAIPAHTFELSEALNQVLSEKWKNLRGIEIVSFGISSITADEDDEAAIKQMQKAAAFQNPTTAAANLAAAQAQAMMDAANNANGAAAGFMGLNMAQNAGGMNAAELYNLGAAQGEAWFCPNCGKKCTGNFCSSCGMKKPEE